MDAEVYAELKKEEMVSDMKKENLDFVYKILSYIWFI